MIEILKQEKRAGMAEEARDRKKGEGVWVVGRRVQNWKEKTVGRSALKEAN